jgi:hypothetical protein
MQSKTDLTVLSLVGVPAATIPTITYIYALALLIGLGVTSWLAYRNRPRGRAWYQNPWLLLPVSILFISPVALLHVPIVIVVPLYLALAIGVYFLSKRSSEIWYKNPLLVILLVLIMVVLFRGTLLTVIALSIIVIGGLNFMLKKIFSK